MSNREHNCAINGAFLMEGFLSAGYTIPELAATWGQGWQGLVTELTECASYLEDKYREIDGPDNAVGLPGVFDYEVTSEVGSWLARCLGEAAGMPTLAQIKAEIDRRVAEFMFQGDAGLPEFDPDGALQIFIASENPECCRKCGTRTDTLHTDEQGTEIVQCPSCGFKYALEQPDEDEDL